MTKKKGGKHTLEGLLALSNEQILGKWSTLASLIRLNEYDESDAQNWSKGWHPSREKALYLLNTNSADEYIEKVRNRVSPKTTITEPTLPIPAEEAKPKDLRKRAMPKSKRSIYAKNYERLVKLIPELEDRFASGKPINGLSNMVGFHGIILLKEIRLENHISDLHIYHYVQEGRDFRIETMQVIRIDVAKMRVEPLMFKCKNGTCKVYHEMKGVSNPLLDTKEQERQNSMLADFLKTLIHHRHRFEWADESQNELFQTLSRYQFSYDTRNDVEQAVDNIDEVVSEIVDKQTELERKTEVFEAERQKKRNKSFQRDFLRMVFADMKENINDEIPEFEPGNVEYLTVYGELGIAQQDIDWLNKNGRGISFFPNPKVGISGFELLPTGKIRFA